jgi:hypothetical protein
MNKIIAFKVQFPNDLGDVHRISVAAGTPAHDKLVDPETAVAEVFHRHFKGKGNTGEAFIEKAGHDQKFSHLGFGQYLNISVIV